MSSTSRELLERTEQLCKTNRIEFVGDLPRTQWPSNHATTLAAVAELGGRKFDQYAAESGDDEPWKTTVKTQTELLVERVRKLPQRNESTWRRHCEPLVFARMDAEVACKNCRKRVWRSAIEACRPENSSTAARALSDRQQARRPCRCPRAARSQDFLEAVGLNRIFCHREDEHVRLDPALAKALKQDSQKPDAIFGLRQTRNIENLLNDTQKRWDESEDAEKQLDELILPCPIVPQPLSQKGDELLFPFLVLEAKSGTSDSDWHAINMQTAFPIKAFLDIQNRLRLATGRRSVWTTGPLVWFFSNRGEDWRVSMAYVEKESASRKRKRDVVSSDVVYRIIDVWRGSISSYDGAMQLQLLVDYVFDWARDVYREDIVREMRILASGENDAASALYSDTDVFSSRQFQASMCLSDHDEGEEYQSYISLQNKFTPPKPLLCPVRHATFMEARFSCLVMTADNVQTLLQSLDQGKKRDLCRKILGLESHHDPLGCNWLDLSTLCAMEEHWTGTSRIVPRTATAEERFYSVISCTTYLSEEWHQIRELYVVAIALSAWAAIAQASEEERPDRVAEPVTRGLTDRGSVIKELGAFTRVSPRQGLLSAIRRKSAKIRPNFPGRDEDAPGPHNSRKEVLLAVSAPDDSAVFRKMVHGVYSYFKKGTLEPREPFLRCSTRFLLQHKLQSDIEQDPRESRFLQESEDGYVLLVQFGFGIFTSPDVCVYIVSGNPIMPLQDELHNKIRRAFETRRGFHITTRETGNLEDSAAQWNLRETYGIPKNPPGYLERFLYVNEWITIRPEDMAKAEAKFKKDKSLNRRR